MPTRGFCCWALWVWGLAGVPSQGAGPPPNAPPGAASSEVRVTLPEDAMTITDKALTTSIPPTKRLQSEIADAIARYPDATVRLSIRGVRPPLRRNAIHGFNIFLNKPDANASTPEDDPHFVRAVEFEPTTEHTPQGFNVNLLRTLVELHKRKELNVAKPLKITIVAIPAPGVSRIPEEASFSVRELALTVPARRRAR
jgi:hypothetical protein